MSAVKLKVLVSGAGITGPCLAYWLSRTRHNISVTVIEKSPAPRVTGQSIDIHGTAVEIVKKMGVYEAIRSCYTTEEGTVILNSSAKPVARFGVGELFTAEHEILRADLSRVFLEATEKFPNVCYMYGDSIKSLEQSEKKVDVTFNGGSKDTYDLVVAADGSASRTRSMILDEATLKDSYQFLGQYNAFYSIPSRPTDPRLWQLYNIPKGRCIMMRPHRNPSTMGVYLSITTPARGQRDPAVEGAIEKGEAKQILHEYFKDAGWEAKRVLEGMDHADDFYMSHSAHIRLPKWTNGRALLLGDTAFATFGAGTSLAIGSAYTLAGEISKIQSAEDVPRAVQRYEEVFRPVFEKADDFLPWFPQALFPQSWGIGVLRFVMWVMSKTKLFKLFPEDPGLKWELPEYDWADV